VVKRTLLSGTDWAHAVAQAMASSRFLRTQAALAKKSGVAQSTIGRILRGEVNPQSSNLEQIARAFGISLATLSDMAQVDPPPGGLTDLTLVERSQSVAVISWAQATTFADAAEAPQLNEAEWMPRPKCSSVRTFALRVRGESMEPEYQHGDIVFVDPDVTPGHGKDVVAQLEGHPEVVFKRLVVEGQFRYLRSANRNWPEKILEISACPGARIIGVVIGKWVQK
jgi:SOS-response transcriptional repressor LexA